MEHTIVIARDFEGKALLRRVWGVYKKVIYLVNDQEDRDVTPIGFPRRDVFLCDDNVLKLLNNNKSHIVNWEDMKPFISKAREI